MAITLTEVAAMDKRIMNPENDFCRLKAMRLAMSKARFNDFDLMSSKLHFDGQCSKTNYR